MKKLFGILMVICFVINFAGVVSAEITGLVAHYPLNGSADDATPNGNDGEVSGATLTTDRICADNAAYDFDGIDDFIEVQNPTDDLNIGDQSWTISAWIQTMGADDVQSIVTRYECGWDCSPGGGGGPNAALYNLYILQNGHPRFVVREDNAVLLSVEANIIVSDGKWHHIVGILDRDSAELKIYVDGYQSNTIDAQNLGSITFDHGSPFEIGRKFRRVWASPIYYFNGKIDDVLIFNRALDDCEVAELYYTY